MKGMNSEPEMKDFKSDLALSRVKAHLAQKQDELRDAQLAKEKAKMSMELLEEGRLGFNSTKHDKERLAIAVRTYSQTCCLASRIRTTIQRLESQRDNLMLKLGLYPYKQVQQN